MQNIINALQKIDKIVWENISHTEDTITAEVSAVGNIFPMWEIKNTLKEAGWEMFKITLEPQGEGTLLTITRS